MPDNAIFPPALNLEQIRNSNTPTVDLAEAKRNYDYDMEKFLKYSSTCRINPGPVALAAYLTHVYHALEKGLALEVPRAGFGVDKIRPTIAAILDLERIGHAGVATRTTRTDHYIQP